VESHEGYTWVDSRLGSKYAVLRSTSVKILINLLIIVAGSDKNTSSQYHRIVLVIKNLNLLVPIHQIMIFNLENGGKTFYDCN
jgi:hypothetical protein